MSGDIPVEIAERGKGFPPIYTPAEFDRRLEDGRIRRDTVAGCTSISLPHLKSGITPVGISIIPYGSPAAPNIYCSLNDTVYQNVFGEQPRLYPGLEETIRGNREYGQVWAIDDMVMERGVKKGYTRGQIYKHFSREFKSATEEILSLGKRFENHSTAELLSGDINPFDIIAREDEEARRAVGMDFDDVRPHLDMFFTGPEDMLQCMIEARRKKGIQAILGDTIAVTEFLRSQKIGPDGVNSAQIFSPIPQRLITALVPLGAYEQEELPKLL